MTEQDKENFNRLCDKIANKVVARMISLNELQTWSKAVDTAKTTSDYDKLDLSEEDKAVSELAKLMTLMNVHQDREEYEKCAIIKKMIKRVNKVLKA
tara:strand:- start:194 stop:484 length:291 start_codon:yes stop_codon:yes gene_type:complete